MDARIKITSGSQSDFNSQFTLDNVRYDVQTEDMGPKICRIVTRIYSRGQIISDIASDYANIADLPDLRERIKVMMERQHKAAIDAFLKEHSKPLKPEMEIPKETKKDIGMSAGKATAVGETSNKEIEPPIPQRSAQQPAKKEEIIPAGCEAAPETEQATKEKTKNEYAADIKDNIRRGDKKAALDIARVALEYYPSDPFFLSFCGYLLAVVENRPKEGTSICEDAIEILKKSESTDKSFFFPFFYLNLGRAYLKGERRRYAIKALKEGLKYDSKNRELLAELQGLGSRKSPVIPFLDRMNPVNIYLGKIRYKLQQKK